MLAAATRTCPRTPAPGRRSRDDRRVSSGTDNTNETHELSDSEVLKELRGTFELLDRWRTVIASRPEPTPDSELANDDQIWPWTPPTSLCIASLGSAREHLHGVRRLIEARELFPSVTSTLARSALMSGSIAVWMLAPDDAVERHRRMLTFALEDYRNHIAFGTQVSQTFHVDDIHPEAGEQMNRLRQRSDEVRELLGPLGGPLRWNLTDIIILRRCGRLPLTSASVRSSNRVGVSCPAQLTDSFGRTLARQARPSRMSTPLVSVSRQSAAASTRLRLTTSPPST